MTNGTPPQRVFGRVGSAAIFGAVVLSLVACTLPGTALAQPRFDKVPTECARALAPARAEIAHFAGDLLEPDDDMETDDVERLDTALHVRCWEIFNGNSGRVPALDAATVRRTSRDLRVTYTVFVADEVVSDPVGEAKRTFDRRRPPGSTQTTGIGDAAYTVTQNTRPTWLLPGTVTGTVETDILISNLIVEVTVSGINVGDMSDPAQISADLAGHATAITANIAANIDVAMA
ncbi:hypothetical protein [Nocardia sp. NPDC058633]|uniref:hypothetical protein n=1 Tax=Nocardia sp. NPDC058633 TaxID=3346568 RepID=UPI00365180A4